MADEIQPIVGGVKHSALVELSVPQIKSIDPGSVRVSTPGYTLDDAQSGPIYEYKKQKNPAPKSILVLMDNSTSMIGIREIKASDPEYLLDSMSCRFFSNRSPLYRSRLVGQFSCRRSTDNQQRTNPTNRPFELLAKWVAPPDAASLLESLRAEENGATPLFRATEQAAKVLSESPKGSKKILVLLTDGKDTDLGTTYRTRSRSSVPSTP